MVVPVGWVLDQLDWAAVYKTARTTGFSEEADGNDRKPRLRPRSVAAGLLELFKTQYSIRLELAQLKKQVDALAAELAAYKSAATTAAQVPAPPQTASASGIGRVVGGRIQVLDI